MLQNFWLDVTILIKSRKILSPVLIILRHNTNENNTRVVATPPSGDYVDHPDKSLKMDLLKQQGAGCVDSAGLVYRHGQEFVPAGDCNTCSCYRGRPASCTRMGCGDEGDR